MAAILQEHPVVKVQQPPAAAGFDVHAVAPVKSVARRLAGRHAGNVARGAFITVVAGAAMALSSITVVSNANRLLRFKPKE